MVINLLQVATHFLNPFKDTWRSFVGGIKTKPSSRIEVCMFLEVFWASPTWSHYPQAHGLEFSNFDL